MYFIIVSTGFCDCDFCNSLTENMFQCEIIFGLLQFVHFEGNR